MKTINNWWKVVFSKEFSSLHDFLYPAERTKKEIKFIIRNLYLKKGKKILDIPCGQGRHSIELAQYGLNVVGADYSSALLNVARERARLNNVYLKFIKRDMRYIRLHERFDAIVTLGNSFGYFDDADNERVVRNISSLLRKGGYFLIDLPNTVGMLRHIKGNKRLKTPHGYVETKNISFNPLNFVVKLQWKITQDHKKKSLFGKLRLYTFPEINLILERYRLFVTEVFGSFNGESYGIETPRLIIIARKK